MEVTNFNLLNTDTIKPHSTKVKWGVTVTQVSVLITREFDWFCYHIIFDPVTHLLTTKFEEFLITSFLLPGPNKILTTNCVLDLIHFLEDSHNNRNRGLWMYERGVSLSHYCNTLEVTNFISRMLCRLSHSYIDVDIQSTWVTFDP